MLTVADIISRARDNVHDNQSIGYTDTTLLGYVNDGIRFLRRTIIDLNPALIADYTASGTVTAGSKDIVFAETSGDGATDAPVSIAYVCDFRINGKIIDMCSVSDIENTEKTGKPELYYRSGMSKFTIWPIPDTDCTYSINGVRDMKLVSLDGVSPFPTDIDDFLVEYVVIRSSITNEFDVSQETSIMGTIVSQIERYIMSMTPKPIFVDGYWDGPNRRRGRWYS